MADDMKIHWTENDDLLAQYVLNRLTEHEQRRLEEHLRTCTQCREAVRQEQELVSGIRQYGRDKIRSRLKGNLGARIEAKRTIVTWQRALSAAAVVLVVAGIGIYNRWFMWNEKTAPVVTQELSEPPQAKAERGANAGKLKDKATSASEQPTTLNVLRNKEDSRRTLQEQSTEPSVKMSMPPIDQAQGLKKLGNAVLAPTTGGAVAMDRKPGQTQNQIMVAQPASTQFWIEGEFLHEQSQVAHEEKSNEKMLAVQRTVPKQKQPEAEMASQSMTAQIQNPIEFQVSQRSVGLLPMQRQQLQRRQAQSVQARVQQAEYGFRLTIYLDTLFSEEDLRNARVEAIQPDSLVVAVKSQQIGFKMPSGFFQSQMELQKARQK